MLGTKYMNVRNPALQTKQLNRSGLLFIVHFF